MEAARTYTPSLNTEPAVLVTSAANPKRGKLESSDKGKKGLRSAADASVYESHALFTTGRPSGPTLVKTLAALHPQQAGRGLPGFAEAQPHLAAALSSIHAEHYAAFVDAVRADACRAVALENVTLSTDAVRELASTESFHKVTCLRVGPNVLAGSQGLAALLTAHAGFKEALCVEGNSLAFEDAAQVKAVADALATARLSHLGLAGNQLDGAACGVLLPALVPSAHLRCLDLSGNDVLSGADGDEPSGLALLLTQNKSLTSLALSECRLDAAGAAAVAGALSASNTVCTPPAAEEELPAPDLMEGCPEEPPPAPAAEGEGGSGGDDPDAALLEEYRAGLQASAAAAAAAKAAAAKGEEAAAPGGDEEEEEEEEAAAADGDGAAPTAAPAEGEAGSEEAGAGDAAEPAAAAEAETAALEAAVAAYAAFLKGVREAVAGEEAGRNGVERALWTERAQELKQEEVKERAEAAERQSGREAKEAARLSGWTHLEELDLSCNAFGSAGAVAVAAMLRSDVPKSEAELEKEEVFARPFAFSLLRPCPHPVLTSHLQEERAAAQAAEEEAAAAAKAAAEEKAAEAAAEAEAEVTTASTPVPSCLPLSTHQHQHRQATKQTSLLLLRRQRRIPPPHLRRQQSRRRRRRFARRSRGCGRCGTWTSASAAWARRG